MHPVVGLQKMKGCRVGCWVEVGGRRVLGVRGSGWRKDAIQ
jgi:hypothetical protein